MAEKVQCPNCHAYLNTRVALYRNKKSQLTDGGTHAWGRVLGWGFVLAVLAAFLFFVNATLVGHPIPYWVIDGCWILAGLLIVATIVRLGFLVSRPTAGYRYTCKPCGYDWVIEREPVRKRASTSTKQ